MVEPLDRDQVIELLLQVEVFREAAPDMLEEIARRIRIVEVAEGVTFMQEGEVDDRMFLIASGRVKVHTGEAVIVEMGRGEMLGEMALLGSGVRSMSVTALEPTRLYSLTKEDFSRLIRSQNEVALGIIDTLIARFRRMNLQYIEELRSRERELSRTVEERTRDLIEKNEELVRTQRFKEQFLANMSHEIRTPLNAIIGMVNLLRKTRVDDKQDSYLRSIKEASGNLRVIIDEILDFSKLEAGKVELESIPFAPREVVDLVRRMMMFKTEEQGLDFEVRVDENLPKTLVGDPVRLNQVLVNLTGNAIKFTPEGGVRIEVETVASDGDEALIEFRVHDTGIGIPEDKQAAVFDKFAQAASDTKRRFGGTGLGLAISKQLVELQEGEIGLESEPGKGSTFWFRIPYRVTEAAELRLDGVDDTLREIREQLRGIRILLVEDNEFNRIVAEDTLATEIEESTIQSAANGREAIERLKDADYDVILMDIQMPEMDGYEASRHIREDFAPPKSGVPIVAMTASVTKAEVDRCFEAGMNDCLAKPFEAEELLRKLQGATAKKPA